MITIYRNLLDKSEGRKLFIMIYCLIINKLDNIYYIIFFNFHCYCEYSLHKEMFNFHCYYKYLLHKEIFIYSYMSQKDFHESYHYRIKEICIISLKL